MERLTRPRWRKVVAAALGAVALALAYLVPANLLLRTRLLRSIVSSSASSGLAVQGGSSELKLEYRSAYSILPGRVHVEGLTMRGRERTVEWFFTLDRADVSVSIVDLLGHNFHATRVRANGLAFRIRLRLDRAQTTPDLVATLPPIPGLADPPILADGPEPGRLSDENYDLWSVNLEDVDVERVREVWIHTVRAAGDARVRGRWFFRPQRFLEVGPAHVDANGIDLFHGEQRLASDLRGSTEATLHPFDPRRVTGAAIIDQVSHDGRLRGRADVAGALRWLDPARDLEFKRCEIPFDSHVLVNRGRLVNGTRVRTESSDCQTEAKGLLFNASTKSELTVAAQLVSVDTHFSGVRVSEDGAERAQITSLAFAITSGQLELARLFEDPRFTLDVRGATTPDLGAWQKWSHSTSPFLVHSGTVTADAQAEGSLAEGRARGALRLSVKQLSVQRGSKRFSGDVTSEVRVQDASAPEASLVAAVTFSVDDARVRLGRTLLAAKLTAEVALRWTWADRKLDLSGSSAALGAFTARSTRGGAAILVVPSLRAAAPRLVLSSTGIAGHVAVELPRADVIALSRIREVLTLPKELRIEAGKLRASLRGDVDLASGSMRGDSQVVARGVRFRVGATELFGDLTGTVRARRTPGAGASTDLSGSTLAIDNAGTGDRPPAEDAWWGNLALRQTVLRWTGGFRFDTMLHLKAKDASVAVALVSQNSSVPKWAASAFRMPGLEAKARLGLAPASLEVRSLVAHGGSASIRTEYAKRDGRQDGAVLVDLGWLNLGYDLAEGAGGLVFFGSERWFTHKTASMRNAEAAAQPDAKGGQQRARYLAMTPPLRRAEATELADSCALDIRSCDGTSIERLLRAAPDASERDTLSGVTHAPLLVAAAKGGVDGSTLDTPLLGGLAEILRIGGESTLDNIATVTAAEAANDPAAARGKVVAATGTSSRLRDEGAYSSGVLTTDSQSVYFLTPFRIPPASPTLVHFRGVFVQRYTTSGGSEDEPPALVLVGAFVP